jgi:hypothetical protein
MQNIHMRGLIDWSQPWFPSVTHALHGINNHDDWRGLLSKQCVADNITNYHGDVIEFVQQSGVPVGTSYEVLISETGQVPTRDNLHDFFNSLVWLSFPKIKRKLNAIQAEQISLVGIGAERGDVRDAATLFDESAALLVVREGESGNKLLDALRNHLWKSLFVDQREEFSNHCDVWLFGHALLEKLVNPYKSITAHAWLVRASDEFFSMPENDRREWLDACVAQQLQQRGNGQLKPSLFTPLPVLGIPGWWPSQDAAFYADEKVFRPKRSVNRDG